MPELVTFGRHRMNPQTGLCSVCGGSVQIVTDKDECNPRAVFGPYFNGLKQVYGDPRHDWTKMQPTKTKPD